MGVRPGEAVKQLCGFETFLCTRLMPAAEDGSIRRLNKEVIFYTDSRTGQMIDEWTNPWTDEKVKVVHVANDPFNYTISEWFDTSPGKGTLGEEKKENQERFPCCFLGNDRVMLLL
ncbi:MAG: hypothetical protein Ct9H300mP4_18150 [Gammaproteobacteria bacterium]|nr:MAG: hypothetical protein Ct9H300mP4_18150 [Gammaproteobacteria bacterium]